MDSLMVARRKKSAGNDEGGRASRSENLSLCDTEMVGTRSRCDCRYRLLSRQQSCFLFRPGKESHVPCSTERSQGRANRRSSSHRSARYALLDTLDWNRTTRIAAVDARPWHSRDLRAGTGKVKGVFFFSDIVISFSDTAKGGSMAQFVVRNIED